MQGQVPGSRNQGTTNKTPLNADNEDNVNIGILGKMGIFIWK